MKSSFLAIALMTLSVGCLAGVPDQVAREVLLNSVKDSKFRIEGTLWLDDSAIDLRGCSLVEVPREQVPGAQLGEPQMTVNGQDPGKILTRVIKRSDGSLVHYVPQIVCTDKIFRNGFQ